MNGGLEETFGNHLVLCLEFGDWLGLVGIFLVRPPNDNFYDGGHSLESFGNFRVFDFIENDTRPITERSRLLEDGIRLFEDFASRLNFWSNGVRKSLPPSCFILKFY